MTNADPPEQGVALYDTHAHFFSNDLQRYPATMANAREGEANLRRRVLAEPATPERVFGLWNDSRVSGGAGVQYNTVYKTDNRYLLDVAEQHPDRIAPVVMLDANAADTPALLEEYVTKRGVVGLRLFGRREPDGSFPWLNSRAALETWKVAERHALTMVLMYVPAEAAPSALEAIASLAQQFPSTSIALDHMGWAGAHPSQLGMSTALLRMREYRNVFYKLTTINFHMFERAGIDAAQYVRRAADIFGADHLMWGSDLGNTLESFVLMAHRARTSAALLTPAERQQYLCDTGTRLHTRRRSAP